MFQRPHIELLKERLKGTANFIQVIAGPRQVGKTTLIRQYLAQTSIPYYYASADSAIPASEAWIRQQWDTASAMKKAGSLADFILVLDEIQRIPNWSESIKALWDASKFQGDSLKLVLLGSSNLLIRKGLTESLAGRFELIRLNHWSYSEIQTAFGLSLEEYIWFGAYPGAAEIRSQESRWKDYILNSLIESTISKDILMMTRIHKPALLRNLFNLGCQYSGQVLSFTKIMGQLQDAGNTTTLSDYLQTLEAAGMLSGLEKYSGSRIMRRSSSPKFQVQNTALISAQSSLWFQQALTDRTFWGRLVESTIGAHLINHASEGHYSVHYWRDGNHEVDYVLQKGDRLIALEVKSGIAKNTSGIQAFARQYPEARLVLVGDQGIPVEEFLRIEPGGLL